MPADHAQIFDNSLVTNLHLKNHCPWMGVFILETTNSARAEELGLRSHVVSIRVGPDELEAVCGRERGLSEAMPSGSPQPKS